MTPSPTARAPPGHADANASTGFSTNKSSWSPCSSTGSSGSVNDKVWAQAIHVVSERRLSLSRAAQLYGLQKMALHRRVRHYEQLRQHQQHQQQQQQQQYEQQLRQPLRRLLSGSSSASGNTSTSNGSSSDSAHGKSKSPFGPVDANAASTNDRYVFPTLNSSALEQRGVSCGSPQFSGPTPALSRPGQSPGEPPASCELTPELNDEVVAVLRDQFRQYRHSRRRMSIQQPYDAPRFDDEPTMAADGYDRERGASESERLEGYADAEIADVVRVIASHNGRRPLSPDFPSPRWLALFKRENGFADVDAISHYSRPRHQHQQYEHEFDQQQQQQQLSPQQQRESEQLGWLRSEQYHASRQASLPSPMPPPRATFRWGTRSDGGLPPHSPPRQYDARSEGSGNYRRGPGSATGSVTSVTSSKGGPRHYRQSNLVPAKVWERAMEDVAIHGMSLRNAAKAHGVHFAALHRRLKKRAQHKLTSPCAPDYIPFEDEAGVVRVIHARAEMGVLLSFGELQPCVHALGKVG